MEHKHEGVPLWNWARLPLSVDFPLYDSSAVAFAELGLDFQSGGGHGLEVYAVVAVPLRAVWRMVLDRKSVV